jgi:hypothetical protein
MIKGFAGSLYTVLGIAVVTTACNSSPLASPTSPTAVGTASGAADVSTGAEGIAPGVLSRSGGGDSAHSLRVRCEQRPSRSRVSVDAQNVAAGNYRARIASGGASALSGVQPAVGDQVEFDFDSNPNDVRAGATAIGAAFIRDGRVSADLVSASGVVVASATASCSVR